MKEAYIYGGLRTPRGKGKSDGALNEVPAIDLLSGLLRALPQRFPFDLGTLGDVIMGCVTPLDEQGADIARIAALMANYPLTVPGVTLNRFCASGSEAVHLAAAKIQAGLSDAIIAGGVESMSRVPMGSDGGAWALDPVVNGALGFIPQGISADLMATLSSFGRHLLDEYAVRSQERAIAAWHQGCFREEILPVRDTGGQIILDHDELPRATTLEQLSALKPSFAGLGALGFDQIALKAFPELETIAHVHHAGNSSGIVDGAVALLMGSPQWGEAMGLKPRARMVAQAVVGTHPTLMLSGPVPAAVAALNRAKLSVSDMDHFEINEAFSAVVLYTIKHLQLPPEKVNPLGGAIALGHPLGATGAVLIHTAMEALIRNQQRYALIALCVGGGMGIATIIENLCR